MPLTVPFVESPDVPAGITQTKNALRGRRQYAREAGEIMRSYSRRDAAATAALNLATVQTSLRTLTGRADDVLIGAEVRTNSSGGQAKLVLARRASDGRTFRAVLTHP
jgi:hypothetical protein